MFINQALVIIDLILQMLKHSPTAWNYSRVAWSSISVMAALAAIMTYKRQAKQQHYKQVFLESELENLTNKLMASDALNSELLEANLKHQRRVRLERLISAHTDNIKARRMFKSARSRNFENFGKVSEIQIASDENPRDSQTNEIFL